MKRDYDCPFYKEARLACIKRDKKRCQMPGCKAKKKLVVHHIERWSDAPSLRFELFNLVTLCKTCHDSIKDKELHYAPLFRSIISGHN
jgi:5-methylcytosine-specific restriction endonuclease McrA